MSKPVVYAIDFRRTTVQHALVTREGIRQCNLSRANPSPQESVDEIARYVIQVQNHHTITGIGVTVAGIFHQDSIVQSSTMSHWTNVPIIRQIADATRLPVIAIHSAQAAALAACTHDSRRLVGVHWSDGIDVAVAGDGLVRLKGYGHGVSFPRRINKKPCGCGKTNCWEALCGGA